MHPSVAGAITTTVGADARCTDGLDVGCLLGWTVGCVVVCVVEILLGGLDGAPLGCEYGCHVDWTELGFADGSRDGRPLGFLVG
jgi:hypothetical protein